MLEVIALLEELGTSVLQPGAVIGIAVTIVIFILEVRWTRSHPPRGRRVEKAAALGHVVTAKRIKYWDDGVTPDEKTTSHYHATYAYEVSGKAYRCKYLERAVPPVQIKLYYDPAAETAEAAKALMDRWFAQRGELQEGLNSLGVSRRHLTGLFEQRYGLSPEQYISQIRFSRAKELLAAGKRVTDVAFLVGMESPSAFAVFFRKQAGVSPSEYLAGLAARQPCCFCETPIGTVRISENEGGISWIRFGVPEAAALPGTI